MVPNTMLNNLQSTITLSLHHLTPSLATVGMALMCAKTHIDTDLKLKRKEKHIHEDELHCESMHYKKHVSVE